MNKPSLQTIIIIGLLLSNIILAALLFLGKPKHGNPHDRPRNMVIERLQFDQNQVAEYDKLIAGHRKQVHQFDSTMRAMKQDLYQNLLVNQSEAKRDSIAQAMGQLQQNIEIVHFNHFMDIKKLCKGEQIKAFELLAGDITEIFAPKHPKRK